MMNENPAVQLVWNPFLEEEFIPGRGWEYRPVKENGFYLPGWDCVIKLWLDGKKEDSVKKHYFS